MTYEKDNIPDFALVPARQPEERVRIPVTQGAVFSPLQITHIGEKPRTIIRLEEDVLVPDTRPDLKDILDISGRIHLPSREFEASARNEDTIPVSGEIELQTLYMPEKAGAHGLVISITNRIAFREQWHTIISPDGSLFMDASIDSIDFMVINERKFRVKIAVSLQAREYRIQNPEVFEGLAGEDLQTLRHRVELTGTALRKKDIVTIKEDLERKETDPELGTILRQDIRVTENYRQATAEKVIINGFIYVSLLCSAPAVPHPQTADEDSRTMEGSLSSVPSLHQVQSRVEFTIFIPLSPGGQWSGSSVTFDGSGLRVRQAAAEDGSDILRLEGDVITWLELYRNQEKEIITDAYHRQKDFVFDLEEIDCRRLAADLSGESGVHEAVQMDNPAGSLSQIVYVSAEVSRAESRGEPGRIITEGTLAASMLCQADAADPDGTPALFTIRQEIPFRCVTAAPQLLGNETIRHKIYLKDIWAEKSGSHQAEFNASVLVCAEAMSPVSLKVLKNPGFEEFQGTAAAPNPMVVYIVKDGDTLWSVARRFKSTTDSIAQLNQAEDGQLIPGKKLLILR